MSVSTKIRTGTSSISTTTSSTSSTSLTATPPAPQAGLTAGATTGIGVGVGVPGCLALGGLFVWLLVRRSYGKQRQGQRQVLDQQPISERMSNARHEMAHTSSDGAYGKRSELDGQNVVVRDLDVFTRITSISALRMNIRELIWDDTTFNQVFMNWDIFRTQAGNSWPDPPPEHTPSGSAFHFWLSKAKKHHSWSPTPRPKGSSRSTPASLFTRNSRPHESQRRAYPGPGGTPRSRGVSHHSTVARVARKGPISTTRGLVGDSDR